MNKAEYQKTYRFKNKDKVRKRLVEWRAKNPDKVKASNDKSSVYRHQRYVKRRTALMAIKVFYGCQNPDCKWNGFLCEYQLDFHHTKGVKRFNVGCSSPNITKLAAEVRKCTVLCACCHREATWGGLDTSDFVTCDVDDELIPKESNDAASSESYRPNRSNRNNPISPCHFSI